MKIVTWHSETAPASQAWIARFLDGKRFLPTMATASTEAGVIAKAQAFWDAELARFAARGGRKPATVADAIIERNGKPDPVDTDAIVLNEEDRQSEAASTTGSEEVDLTHGFIVESADEEEIDLLA